METDREMKVGIRSSTLAAEEAPSSQRYRAIQDYAVIGDSRSAALVSSEGSIDWLCWPCFDSPAIFASLLSAENGGYWKIAPTEPTKTRRSYEQGTNVLKTVFETDSGSIQLTDFMPVATEAYKDQHLLPDSELIRIVEGLRGTVEIAVRFDPRPQYGKVRPRFKQGRFCLRADANGESLALHSNLEFAFGADGATATSEVRSGDRLAFSLTRTTESPSALAVIADSGDALKRTTSWWREWSGRCSYLGPYREAVLRSALILKLLHFAPSGAFIAALTSSLPEVLGGEKNYDYRYCWLRDASLTIHALCGAGFPSEAAAFGEWMLHTTRLTQPKLMVMYDLYGKPASSETELSHLTGYENSKPVRIGNMARDQIQMDIYGEVICGTAKLHQGIQEIDRETSKILVNYGNYVCDHWKEPDAGIWEPRGDKMIHTHSLLLCWVALQELIGLYEKGLLKRVPLQHFTSVREEIRRFIELHAWDEKNDSYSSEPGSSKMDATLLLLAYHNFHPASCARMRGTYARIKSELGAGGPLLYRYRSGDGGDSEPEEGAFGICGFWAAEYLAMGGGSLQEAESAFRDLLSYGNDVGVFAEEVDPETGSARGNFPQAFTHVGLISAALAIERRRGEESGHKLEACPKKDQE